MSDDSPSLVQRFDQFMMSILSPFRDSVETAVEQQQAESDIHQTAHGPLEYAVVRPDLTPTVLIAHSAVGGYDQGVAIARRFKSQRVIAVSRAGYLRTPTETGPTPEAMADAYASLLDALGIERVVMAGLSAGGMSAVSFALRHPDRCVGLFLGAAITQPLPPLVQNLLAPISLSNESDFVNWLVSGVTQKVTIPLRAQDEDTRVILEALLNTHPTSHRWPGYRLDMQQAKAFRPVLADIRAPTLLIHGTADVLVPLAHAQQAAAAIPEAQLVTIEGGQHDCPVLYPDQVGPPLRDFLAQVLA